MTPAERRSADDEQCYEWVLTEKAYGEWSREFAEALVRNARHRAFHRILGKARDDVARWMKRDHMDLVDEYNANANKYQGSLGWTIK